MSSNFKDLNLDRERLKYCVEQFCSMRNIEDWQYIDETNRKCRLKYEQDGKNVTIEFHFRKNGTTTIHTKLGKHQDMGEELASYLKKNLVDDQRSSISLTVKDVSEDIFNFLVDGLKEVKKEASGIPSISIEERKEAGSKLSVKIRSQYNDTLVLTLYRTTNKLLLQGKPLYGYNQVIYFLSEFTDLDGFIHIISKGEESSSNLDIDKEDIEDDLKRLLPNAYSHLGRILLTLLRTSWILKDTPISLPDYSCYVYPSLRALEGVMRKMLNDQGFSVSSDNDNQLGGLFYKDRYDNNRYKPTDLLRGQGIDTKTCEALAYCYTYFVQNRHTLFHMEDITDLSRIIERREKAVQMIEKILDIIDTTYKMAS